MKIKTVSFLGGFENTLSYRPIHTLTANTFARGALLEELGAVQQREYSLVPGVATNATNVYLAKDLHLKKVSLTLLLTQGVHYDHK